MGAVVSAEDEKPESRYAKSAFETFTVADVYKICVLCKLVMGPVHRDRVARGMLDTEEPDAESDEDSSGGESGSGSDEESEESVDEGELDPKRPLTSLFGVTLSFSDFFNVFGL